MTDAPMTPERKFRRALKTALLAYAYGDRTGDWVAASREFSREVEPGSLHHDLCVEMCRLQASTCREDLEGLVDDVLRSEVDALRSAIAAQREANEKLTAAAQDVDALASGNPRSCGCRSECTHVWDNLHAALTAARAATTTTTNEGGSR